jgi:hypothetical protein
VNVQVIADPAGRLIWAHPPCPAPGTTWEPPVIGETSSQVQPRQAQQTPRSAAAARLRARRFLLRTVFTRSSESGSAGGVSDITSAVLVLHHTNG